MRTLKFNNLQQATEKAIEEYLCYLVKRELKGIPYKFTSPNRRSVPDRLCVLPNGRIIFVEVKASAGVLTVGQKREISRLKTLGHEVYVIFSKAQAASLISKIKEEQNANEDDAAI